MENIKGKVLKYGDNINTDIISPPQYMELSLDEASHYAMTSIDPEFPSKAAGGAILVAGSNFGSGSSRETAPAALKYLGVRAIVARSFARIFYRNAINLGLPVIECSQIDKIYDGAMIEIDMEHGKIHNLTTAEDYIADTLSPHLFELIQCGGLENYLKQNR